jgi:hypothetical protein
MSLREGTYIFLPVGRFSRGAADCLWNPIGQRKVHHIDRLVRTVTTASSGAIARDTCSD